MYYIVRQSICAHNKRFKRDSQRAAFLLCVGLCGLRCYALSCQWRWLPLKRALVASQQQISRLEIFVSDVVHALFEF